MVNVKDILDKHAGKIEKQMGSYNHFQRSVDYSREYKKFKDEIAPQFSKYERWCHSLGSLIRLRVSKKDEIKIKRNLEIAHLDVEPAQALTLSVMTFLSVFFIGLSVSVAIALIQGSIAAFPLLFFFLVMMLSMFLFYFMNSYPERLANQWRLKASSQMVPAVLYIVVYMRHTPNLEKAINFAATHLQPPLALDFRKVFYDVEIGKFSTIKESLDNYLETWRDYSTEFIEAFHLIEGSLFEPDNNRRIASLEKSLQVILDGVYDKMLKFTHDVRSPLTNVYMLGVVLPTLGLALLPLASAMLQGKVTFIHVFVLFNLIVPFFVFFLIDKVLLMRPGGHGETSLLEKNKKYFQFNRKSNYIKAFLIAFPFIFLSLTPLIFQYTPIPGWIGLQQDYTFAQVGIPFLEDEFLFGFEKEGGRTFGPFGIFAFILSLFFPLGIALFFWSLSRFKTKELIIERENTKKLESEFNNSLFQIGNRMGNGVPPELVFSKVAESSKGLMTEDFFRRVNYNVQQMGMSVESAIFDENRGALIYFPSELIATSMRVLVESSKKGLKIAALSLMSISEYVKNIQKISARLRDMLAEIVSDMKSNMTFLAPLLSGIVVGLAVMISAIIGKLELTGAVAGADPSVGLGGMTDLLRIFSSTMMIPPYFLQIAVGIYLIQIIYILTGALVIVDSGPDVLEIANKRGSNLFKGILLYFIVSLITAVALFVLSLFVIGGVVG
jgi:hypothetical protein